jgi:hypothetical protein
LTFKGWRTAFGWASGGEQNRLDSILDEAAKLDQVVQQWPAMADRFGELETRVRAVEQPAQDPPASLAPLLLPAAHSFLAPLGGGPMTKQLTIDQARRLVDEVPKTTKALELLPVAAQLHKDLLQLPMPTQELTDREVFAEAHRLDRLIRAEFASAQDAAVLEQANVDELLVRQRSLIWQLPPPDGGRLASMLEGEAPAPEPPIAVFAAAGRLARAAWSAVSSTREIDLLWLLVAIATAVWTGLALYYFDKPWGRPADFLILFLWSFGTTTILTSVLSALENAAAGPLPLKKPNAERPKA